MVIVDITTPSAPKKVGGYSALKRTSSVFVENNIAYVTDAQAGLVLLDVSIPAAPKELASFHSSQGEAWGVFVQQNLIFLANGLAGLEIFTYLPSTPSTIFVFYSLFFLLSLPAIFVIGAHLFKIKNPAQRRKVYKDN